MESEGSNSEAETQVQDSAPAAEAPTEAAASVNAPKERFFDRFGKGSIATMAAIAGLAVGVGGSAVLGDEDHDGWRHHRGDRFGMERGGWGGPQGGRGQGGPPPMMYRGQGGQQGGVAPGTQQQAPQTQQAPQGNQSNPKGGSNTTPPAAGAPQAY